MRNLAAQNILTNQIYRTMMNGRIDSPFEEVNLDLDAFDHLLSYRSAGNSILLLFHEAIENMMNLFCVIKNHIK